MWNDKAPTKTIAAVKLHIGLNSSVCLWLCTLYFKCPTEVIFDHLSHIFQSFYPLVPILSKDHFYLLSDWPGEVDGLGVLRWGELRGEVVADGINSDRGLGS